MTRRTDMYKTTTTIAGFTAALLCSTAAISAETSTSASESGDWVAMKYDVVDSEVGMMSSFHASSPCAVHIVPTVDARQNKETIGQSINGALLVGDIGPWVTEGLGHLKDFGYTVTEGSADAPPAADGVTIRTSVTRAYTWQIGLKIFSMVAVKAEFADRNGVLQQKYYRSHGDKTNMWGAKTEYVNTLNYGLNNLLPFIARDLQSLCKGEKVDGYSYAGPDGLPK
ncbi:hypothetical protein BGV67_00190 [Burkholderia ubonensis]|nr:hypothetical protein WJ29_12295 [Burkholderia ubonensis]KVO87473.1 hypothetical protein WJ81_16275 [Burkholderia ubonensis]KVP23320.1 hypothetical protein WJ84_06310 [Burkholderia ubonensis]KVP47363.1 hypothetical protein WJ89_00810 [Burkholderia ubonensis]KVQ85182.1 hypothetical protein WK06_07520 [Burkholderia ubonensis]